MTNPAVPMRSGKHHNFGNVIGMQFRQAFFQLCATLSHRLDYRQNLLAGFHFSLPAIDGFHARQNVDTCFG